MNSTASFPIQATTEELVDRLVVMHSLHTSFSSCTYPIAVVSQGWRLNACVPTWVGKNSQRSFPTVSAHGTACHRGLDLGSCYSQNHNPSGELFINADVSNHHQRLWYTRTLERHQRTCYHQLIIGKTPAPLYPANTFVSRRLRRGREPPVSPAWAWPLTISVSQPWPLQRTRRRVRGQTILTYWITGHDGRFYACRIHGHHVFHCTHSKGYIH